MQSDQSLYCLGEETLEPWLSKMCPVKILFRLIAHADLNLCWVRMSEGSLPDVVAPIFLISVVTCSPPPESPHSTYSPGILVYNYSDSVTFTCDLGYNHSSGDLVRSCNEHAQWTGDTPVCSSKRQFTT